MASNINHKLFKNYRPLASSSKLDEDKQTDFSTDLNRLRVLSKFEHELQKNMSTLNTELHEQRLKNLREEADKLKEDSWKYPSVEKLLGL